MHVELIKLVGRMCYGASYGQNLLHHSQEVAQLMATMASEPGLNNKLAKWTGLLHDIGKVAAERSDLSHAMQYREHPEVYTVHLPYGHNTFA